MLCSSTRLSSRLGGRWLVVALEGVHVACPRVGSTDRLRARGGLGGKIGRRRRRRTSLQPKVSSVTNASGVSQAAPVFAPTGVRMNSETASPLQLPHASDALSSHQDSHCHQSAAGPPVSYLPLVRLLSRLERNDEEHFHPQMSIVTDHAPSSTHSPAPPSPWSADAAPSTLPSTSSLTSSAPAPHW